MIKIKIHIFFLFIALVSSPLFSQTEINYSIPVNLEWVDSIQGDFSFTKNWSYPMGVVKKQDGRAGCADGGLCPQRCYGMMDSNGIVLEDSAQVFYQLLDTTHLYHTISCEAWCYEWAGTHFLHVKRVNPDSIFCYTQTGIATHCSLLLGLNKKTCHASIDLNSITNNGGDTFWCTKGNIRIDKNYWKKGIVKAKFSFVFNHPEQPKVPIFWKGLVFSAIRKSKLP